MPPSRGQVPQQGLQPWRQPPSPAQSAQPPYVTPARVGPVPANTAVYERKGGPGVPVRVLWYIFVGWWLTGLGMLVAWLAGITLIGLPLSFWLVNRVPTMLTLRPRYERYVLEVGPDGYTRERMLKAEQSSIGVRIIYFILVGWWLSGLWMVASYVLMLTIIGIPFGLMMANRLPLVFSLHRGYA
jgi:uncharacterized membrane protein YccF (DUF307 family)